MLSVECRIQRVFFRAKKAGAPRWTRWQDFHPPSNWYQRAVCVSYTLAASWEVPLQEWNGEYIRTPNQPMIAFSLAIGNTRSIQYRFLNLRQDCTSLLMKVTLAESGQVWNEMNSIIVIIAFLLNWLAVASYMYAPHLFVPVSLCQ